MSAGSGWPDIPLDRLSVAIYASLMYHQDPRQWSSGQMAEDYTVTATGQGCRIDPSGRTQDLAFVHYFFGKVRDLMAIQYRGRVSVVLQVMAPLSRHNDLDLGFESPERFEAWASDEAIRQGVQLEPLTWALHVQL